VFCGQMTRRDFWGVSLDPDSGKVSSTERRQLTTNTASNDGIGLATRDGKSVIFNSLRSGNSDIRRIDFGSHTDTPLVATPAQEYLLDISSDGSKMLYSALENKDRVLYAGSAADGSLQKVCTRCSAVITPDGSAVYYSTPDPKQDRREVSLLNLASGTRSRAFSLAKEICFPCTSSRFSQDGRWVASLRTDKSVVTGIVLHTAPRAGDPKVVASIGTPGDGFSYWSPATSLVDWSPSGSLFYFASDRDTNRCIWAQRLDPGTKRPSGEPFAVYHNHGRLSYVLNALTVTGDKLVLGMTQGSSDIWTAKLD
jgi:WD40 repeat protein